MLHLIDWMIVFGYLLFAVVVGFYFSKRAGKSVEDYFVSGRCLPWWLVGTSMVATTFAADTPLVVSGFVFTKGIAGNWYWWSGGLAALLAAIFYAPLWRRANILTDNELIELRYSGRPASVLRAFRAVFFGVMLNCITIGWVMLAMVKISSLIFSWNEWTVVWILFGLTVFYTVLSGLWGVIITDFFQFIFAMGGSITLAAISIVKMGGFQGLLSRLQAGYGPERVAEISCFIPYRSGAMPFSAFLIYIILQWWAVGYTDGGGYLSQRLFAAKDERHARLAALWYSIAHYCLRPWPWIAVGLTALVVYPNIADPETAYPKVMFDFLPIGLKGMMLASFLAAFMSTIDTQINWGASYLINDIYKRFLVRGATEHHYVRVSRCMVVLLALIGALVSLHLCSIEWAWKYFSSVYAGVGFIYLLRWFWRRINAWSEISAMLASVVVSNFIYIWTDIEYPYTLLYTIGFSVPIAFLVTFLSAPVSDRTWKEYCRRVEPYKLGRGGVRRSLAVYVCSVLCLYALLVGIGKVLFGSTGIGATLIVIALCAGFFMMRLLRRSYAPS